MLLLPLLEVGLGVGLSGVFTTVLAMDGACSGFSTLCFTVASTVLRSPRVCHLNSLRIMANVASSGIRFRILDAMIDDGEVNTGPGKIQPVLVLTTWTERNTLINKSTTNDA